jgi:hypothetical protein
MELIDCRQMISSSTIGACTIVVDAWGASTCCSMDVFKGGEFHLLQNIIAWHANVYILIVGS